MEVKTRCKKNAGGLQSSLAGKRAREEEDSVRRLVAAFPQLLQASPESAPRPFRSKHHMVCRFLSRNGDLKGPHDACESLWRL